MPPRLPSRPHLDAYFLTTRRQMTIHRQINLRKQNEPTMKSALLSPGEKIHVMYPRRFEKDVCWHFVGKIESYEPGVARASGYVFVIDDLSQHLFVKRPDGRTKLVPSASTSCNPCIPGEGRPVSGQPGEGRMTIRP